MIRLTGCDGAAGWWIGGDMGKDKPKKDKQLQELIPARQWAGVGELRALADSLDAAVLVVDATGGLLFASDRFQGLAEAAEAPLEGGGWIRLLDPEERPRAKELWLAAAETREPRSAELALIGETPHRMLCRIAPVQEEERVVRWMVTLSDPAASLPASLTAEAASLDTSERLRAEAEAEERLLNAEMRLVRSQAELASLQDRIAAVEGERSEAQAGREDIEERLRTLEALLAEAQDRLRESEAQRTETEDDRRSDQAGLIDALSRLAEAEDRLRTEEATRQGLEGRLADAAAALQSIEEQRRNDEERRRASEVRLEQTESQLQAEQHRRHEEEAQRYECEQRLMAIMAQLQAAEVEIEAGTTRLRDEQAQRQVSEVRLAQSLDRLHGLEAALADREARIRSEIAYRDEARSRQAEAETLLNQTTDRLADTEMRLQAEAVRRQEAEAGRILSEQRRLAADARAEDAVARLRECMAMQAETEARLQDLEERRLDAERHAADALARLREFEEMAASDARLAATLNALPLVAWWTGPDGSPEGHSHEWTEFTGMPVADWTEAVHPEDVAALRLHWTASLQTGEPFAMEIRLRHRKGDHRWMQARAQPVHDGSGTLLRWIITCTDIHDRVTALDALSESRAEAEHAWAEVERRVAERTASLADANARLARETQRREAAREALAQSQRLEALGRLAAGVARDFGNVLAALAGGFAVIERRLEDPRLVEVAGHGAAAAMRGGDLVRRLLAFAGEGPQEMALIDPAQKLAEAQPALAHLLGDQVELQLDVEEGLPAFRTDPVMLDAAILALAANARDAMPDGGALTLAARRSLPSEPGRPDELGEVEALAIRVADTGHGMTPEILARALDPFFTTKGPGEGTGLGLSMVHSVVRQSGGAIRLDSHSGHGTTVSLYLPVAAGQPEEIAEVEPSAVRAASILLLEADEDLRAVAAALLAEAGHRVTEAADLGAAMAALGSKRFDLVLADADMGGSQGEGLVAGLRLLRADQPILLMTACVGRSDLEGLATIRKPFDPAALRRALETALIDPVVLGRGAAEDTEPDGKIDPLDLDRMMGRLRDSELRAALARWKILREQEAVPRMEAWDDSGPDAEVILAEPTQPDGVPRFRLAQEGALPKAALGRLLAVAGNREAAWRRCIETNRPVHEYAQVSLGPARQDSFERLVLPFSADGRTADRLLSIAASGPSSWSGRDEVAS